MSDLTEKQPQPVTYRSFTADDVPAAHALSVIVKWPHRPEDWRFAFDAGVGFVAEQDGAVIGTALCWKFGLDRASLGLVIVSPDHQGHGIGRKLMEMLLAETGERMTFLHATRAGQPLYEKLGFQAFGSLDQHQGAVFQPALVSLPPGERLRPLGVNDTPRLIELASRASGLDRSAVLPALLQAADGIALDRDGELVGFSLFRRFGRGYTIGPVVAPTLPGDDATVNTDRAKALIRHWLAINEGAFIRIDMPTESGLSDWLTGLGLPRVDTVMRMVRNATLPLETDTTVKQYGIINQAMY